MHPAMIAALTGPVIGTFFSIILYLAKKNMDEMSRTLNKVNDAVVQLAIEIPKTYCTKEELLTHIRSEQLEHQHTNEQLLEIRNELSIIRSRYHS